MKKLGIILVSTVLALPAFAHEMPHHPKTVLPTKIGGSPPNVAPLAATAGVMGCATGVLMISAAIKGATEHRELTYREANMIVFGCMIPVVGALMVDAAWKADPTLEAKCRQHY